MIPPAAVDFYRQNGYYLHRQPLFGEAQFQKLSAIFEEHLAQKGDKRADQLDVPHFRDPRLFEFLLAEEVLDLVEPFLGPDFALWSSHFICKEPQIGRATPWHEDSAYWKGRLDRMDQILTVWLALDRVDRENGCMKVIAGSQHNGFSEYEPVDPALNTFGRQIVASQVDESRTVYFELEPNQCSLHDARLIHGADPNTSTRRRCGYTLRYMAQTSRFLPEHNGTHKIYHARGRNPLGNLVQPVPSW
jgi:ectoine hydroxylase-related dioxygenase (phytanoyl-CoA dioxygenase family)